MPEEDDEWEDKVYDGKTGQLLSPELVRQARAEELSFMRKINLFDEVDVEECLKMIGKHPVSTKWVDMNKGKHGRA